MNIIEKLQMKYKVPLAHIARSTGQSARTIYRHRYGKGPMPEVARLLYEEKYRIWGWEGSGFYATRYHRQRTRW